MIEQTGKSLRYFFQFTNSGSGATGLTVTADVYDQAMTLIVNNGACTEVADGVYYYDLAAGSNDANGTYLAIATTTGTCDINDRPALWYVPQWTTRAAEVVAASESAAGTGFEEDLASIRAMLRKRLNDVEVANYTTAELDFCINLAYVETVVAAKSHQGRVQLTTTTGRIQKIDPIPTAGGTGYAVGDILTITTGGSGGQVEVTGVSSGIVTGLRVYAVGSGYTVGSGKVTSGGSGSGCTVKIITLAPVFAAGTHTYDGYPIFEPTEVRIGDTVLDPTTLVAIGGSTAKWDNTASDTPNKCLMLTGGSFRVHPTPDAGALGVIGTLASAPTAAGTGYTVNDVLTITSGGADATCKVLTITGGGATGPVGTVEIVLRGTGYSVAAGNATSGGTGTGCTLNITALAPLTVYGYMKPDPLMMETDVPLAIQTGLRVVSILDRAESEARRMRSTFAGNIALSEELHRKWENWVEQIRFATKGAG